MSKIKNFLKTIRRNFNYVDTKIREVNPIISINFFTTPEGITKFYGKKYLLFDLYLRCGDYYIGDDDNYHKIDDTERSHDVIIPDKEEDSISFSNTNDIHTVNGFFIIHSNGKKYLNHVVRYLKRKFLYGFISFVYLSLGAFIIRRNLKMI